MATNFWTKITINEREQECDYLQQGIFVVGQSKEDISDCRGLRDIAMATKFWPK